MRYKLKNSSNVINYFTSAYKGYGEAGASIRKKTIKSFKAQSGSPNEDINYNNFTLRQRSRMLYMSAPIATSAIKTNRTNVIGMGLKPKSKINLNILRKTPEQAEKWQKNAEFQFSLWANDKLACDATGINDFYSMQQLAFTSQLMSGDSFVLIDRYKPTAMRPYSLRLRIIEADRVSTPTQLGASYAPYYTDGKASNGNKIFDGVEVNYNGLVQAYYISNKYPFESGRISETTKWVRVPVVGEQSQTPNILHMMVSERPDQYRGVPYLAQIIEPLLQMRRYTDSELMAALVNSFFTAFITTEQADKGIFNNNTEDVPNTIVNPDDEYVMGPGAINYLNPGESVSFGDPKHPNSGFDKFMVVLCQLCGAALEIPADLLMKAFNSSYSASRAALLEAWKSFKMRRSWFISDFCQPVWELFIDEAVANGSLVAPGYFSNPLIRRAYLGTQWIGPSQGQLDPIKEVTAEILSNENGYTTRGASTVKLNGSDWDDNMVQITRENEKLSIAKSQLNITLNLNEERDDNEQNAKGSN